ncbi:MAG: aminotransferase class III-fold pyridoxal phosphate-dependent enzyme, partial [Planctomycetota bacterium]
GHPAACAVALANLRILQREQLVDRIKNDIGPYLQKQWAQLTEHRLVGEARMVGLMGAFEIVRDAETLERFDEKVGAGGVFRDHVTAQGLCLRASGDSIICAPPFILSHSEADKLIELTWKSLDLAATTLGV